LSPKALATGEALAKGEGETATIKVPPGKAGGVQVVSGEVEVGGEGLGASDAVGAGESIEIKSIEVTELIIFVL